MFRSARILLLTLLALPLAAQQPPTSPVVPKEADRESAAQIIQRIPPPPPDASDDELEQSADKLRADKAYADAIDYYRAALEKNREKRAALHNKAGIAYMQMTRFGDAKDEFEEALDIDRNYAEARNNLGVLYYLQKKYGKSVKEYEKALRMNPNSAIFHSNLGSAYFARREFDKASQHYVRALQLDPGIFERISNVGITAHMSSPEDRAHYAFILARIFAAGGDLDRSLRYLRRSMEEGYDGIDQVYQDDAFAALRQDPRFEQLMKNRPPAIPN